MLDTTRLAEFVKLADRLADALRHQPILSIGEAQTLADYDAFVAGEDAAMRVAIGADRIYAEYVEEGGGQ